MPDLTGEQLVTLVLAFLGPTGVAFGAVGAFWRHKVSQPQEKRISDLERAQAEAKESRDGFRDFIMARIAQAEKEREDAYQRAEVAISSSALLASTLKELTGVVSDGNKSVIEEIRIIRTTVETIQRNQ